MKIQSYTRLFELLTDKKALLPLLLETTILGAGTLAMSLEFPTASTSRQSTKTEKQTTGQIIVKYRTSSQKKREEILSSASLERISKHARSQS